MGKEVQVTREGYEKLKAELEELQGPVRLNVAEAIREAKSHGDLRENAAYHEAKLNQTRLESRIADLEKVLQTAKIVERPDVVGDAATLGSKLVLLDIEFDDELEIKLVGSFESDIANGLISISSPLGEACMGRVKGDEIKVEAPGGTASYRVLSIEA